MADRTTGDSAGSEDDRPRLLVVQPDPIAPLDRLGTALTDAGMRIRLLRPYAGEAVPRDLDEDGLVVLGGSMSAWQDDEYPWLADVRDLLGRTVDRSRPTLGICLGAQLLAQAARGTVTAGDHGLEAGVLRIRWRPEAADDPLVAGLPSPFPAGSMHGDTVRSLPDGAVWLAHGELYPHQAFRVGDSAWGVQFHPEISGTTFRTWVSAHTGDDPADVLMMRRGTDDFERYDAEVLAATETLAGSFAGLVRAYAMQRI